MGSRDSRGRARWSWLAPTSPSRAAREPRKGGEQLRMNLWACLGGEGEACLCPPPKLEPTTSPTTSACSWGRRAKSSRMLRRPPASRCGFRASSEPVSYAGCHFPWPGGSIALPLSARSSPLRGSGSAGSMLNLRRKARRAVVHSRSSSSSSWAAYGASWAEEGLVSWLRWRAPAPLFSSLPAQTKERRPTCAPTRTSSSMEAMRSTIRATPWSQDFSSAAKSRKEVLPFSFVCVKPRPKMASRSAVSSSGRADSMRRWTPSSTRCSSALFRAMDIAMSSPCRRIRWRADWKRRRKQPRVQWPGPLPCGGSCAMRICCRVVSQLPRAHSFRSASSCSMASSASLGSVSSL
mmetsp:Transcript_33586/g.73314  ORF Transcript_33586/g.73314 Transcript_33586/m.73314 type:complete len:350 (-) Transcript_33586:329-1378(-)